MSSFEKLKKKFKKKPVPNDLTLRDVEILAGHYGCRIANGGKHVQLVSDDPRVRIPIPLHGKFIGEAYVKQLAELFAQLDEEW